MQSNWKKSFDLILGAEGGYANDPHDTGGMTNLGVTRAVWEQWVGRPSNEKEMRSLTAAMVEPLYHRNFWDACKCDSMPTPIDYLVFDFAVNAGVGRSAKTLQSVVGTTQDGAIGPETLKAVNRMNVRDLIEMFSHAKIEYYKSLHNQYYETGWLNRVATVKTAALSMV
jgi:lysozyme family protein